MPGSSSPTRSLLTKRVTKWQESSKTFTRHGTTSVEHRNNHNTNYLADDIVNVHNKISSVLQSTD